MTRHIRFPVAPPLTEAQQKRLDRMDAAPPAPESFRHLTTCPATHDTPGLCECPAAFLTLDGDR